MSIKMEKYFINNLYMYKLVVDPPLSLPLTSLQRFNGRHLMVAANLRSRSTGLRFPKMGPVGG